MSSGQHTEIVNKNIELGRDKDDKTQNRNDISGWYLLIFVIYTYSKWVVLGIITLKSRYISNMFVHFAYLYMNFHI